MPTKKKASQKLAKKSKQSVKKSSAKNKKSVKKPINQTKKSVKKPTNQTKKSVKKPTTKTKQTKYIGGSFPGAVHDAYGYYQKHIRAGAVKAQKGKYCAVWYAGGNFNHAFFPTQEAALKHIVAQQKQTSIASGECCCMCVGNEALSLSRSKKVKGNLNGAKGSCPKAYMIPVSLAHTDVTSVTRASKKRKFFIDTLSDGSSISTAIQGELKAYTSFSTVSINGAAPVPQYAVYTTTVLADLDTDDIPLLGRDFLNHYKQVYDPPKKKIDLSWSG